MDEEARIEGELSVEDCVRVASGAGITLEHFHLVRAREEIRRPEARDATADHRYPHNRYSPAGEYRFKDG